MATARAKPPTRRGSPTEKERGLERAARRKKSSDLIAKLVANQEKRVEARSVRKVKKADKRRARSVARGRTPAVTPAPAPAPETE